ncbi:MAG: hypothetical protein ACKVT2_11915 [Saprospiraceae bacterium]
MASSNRSLAWYQRFVWIGIILNLFFAVPALSNPESLTSSLGLPYLDYYDWLQNSGMLILSLNIFYAVASRNPVEHSSVNWWVVGSRVLAVVFWIYMILNSVHGSVFYSMLAIDGAMAVLLGVLLQTGLPAENKMSWGKIGHFLTAPLRWIRQIYQNKRLRYISLASLLLLGTLTFILYNNLLRARPDIVYEKDEDQFKYGAIGLGMNGRIPYHIFKVLPEIFKDKLPNGGEGGYRSLGFIFEPGKDLPVGLSKRQIGYVSVEPNCAFCHTGTYREMPDGEQNLVLGAPAHELDLEAFQWFMYNCAADPRFNKDTLMKYIDNISDMGFTERWMYKNLIIPLAKQSLNKQGKSYAWEKQRPLQGKGRTDTFNPTKFNVFHMGHDNTIGTVDLPQVWNQRPRQDLYLHWDGNNNSLRERNYAAAMAVGATPQSVITKNFNRVTDFLLDLPSAKYPFAIDQNLAATGQKIFDDQCASCHRFGEKLTGHVTELEDIGTDPNRVYSLTEEMVNRFHSFQTPPFKFDSYRKTYGYSNTPLDGIWARAPYLHNGSVPTIWDLLQVPENRPRLFFKGYNVYDQKYLGFVSQGADAEKYGFRLDVALTGNSNRGHLYGTQLDEASKWALLEYLKTL